VTSVTASRGIERQKLRIGGEAVGAAGGETFATVNPATGRDLARVDLAGAEDVDRAVAAAAEAQKAWARRTGTERGRILHRASQLLRERTEELATLEAQDAGKPIAEARSVDVPSAADALEYFAGLAPTLHGEHYDFGGSFAYTRREPLGVCAGIGAWNYPLQIACWKAAPALACGNAMVLKPSELTPLTALVLADVFRDAGLPAGLFNVVQGGREVGRALTTHPGVAKVSLTGSVATGKAVMAGAAATLKHVTLELGGKSPLVVFADADLDQAVTGAMLANFFTQGEVCSNGTRVFVEAKIAKEFTARLLERVARLRLGDPLDPATTVGALISREHLEKVEGYVASAKADGARLLVGGDRPRWQGDEAHLAGGYFLKPAVFDQCADGMRFVREEIFGPVMAVLTFDGEDEAVERSNATPFGLAAGVYTRDLRRAHRVAAALQAGICWVNTYNVTPVEIPFGGIKDSGLGRENGLAALSHYTQLKTVYVEMNDVPSPY
jgi:betaine-aldehyde dehydrogenase